MELILKRDGETIDLSLALEALEKIVWDRWGGKVNDSNYPATEEKLMYRIEDELYRAVALSHVASAKGLGQV